MGASMVSKRRVSGRRQLVGVSRGSRVDIVETGATVRDTDASDDGSDFSLDHPGEPPPSR